MVMPIVVHHCEVISVYFGLVIQWACPRAYNKHRFLTLALSLRRSPTSPACLRRRLSRAHRGGLPLCIPDSRRSLCRSQCDVGCLGELSGASSSSPTPLLRHLSLLLLLLRFLPAPPGTVAIAAVGESPVPPRAISKSHYHPTRVTLLPFLAVIFSLSLSSCISPFVGLPLRSALSLYPFLPCLLPTAATNGRSHALGYDLRSGDTAVPAPSRGRGSIFLLFGSKVNCADLDLVKTGGVPLTSGCKRLLVPTYPVTMPR